VDLGVLWQEKKSKIEHAEGLHRDTRSCARCLWNGLRHNTLIIKFIITGRYAWHILNILCPLPIFVSHKFFERNAAVIFMMQGMKMKHKDIK
jgi:hypothetical protein